eukprot:5144827-Pyramimonas_sp.AAC.1
MARCTFSAGQPLLVLWYFGLLLVRLTLGWWWAPSDGADGTDGFASSDCELTAQTVDSPAQTVDSPAQTVNSPAQT